MAGSVGGGEDRRGRERRNKWGPTQSCRERHSGRTLTTDASLARLASPRSFSLPPSPFALLATISSSPSSNSRVARRTISLTLSSVARISVCGLFACQRRIPCRRLGLCRLVHGPLYFFLRLSSLCPPFLFFSLSPPSVLTFPFSPFVLSRLSPRTLPPLNPDLLPRLAVIPSEAAEMRPPNRFRSPRDSPRRLPVNL